MSLGLNIHETLPMSFPAVFWKKLTSPASQYDAELYGLPLLVYAFVYYNFSFSKVYSKEQFLTAKVWFIQHPFFNQTAQVLSCRQRATQRLVLIAWTL